MRYLYLHSRILMFDMDESLKLNPPSGHSRPPGLLFSLDFPKRLNKRRFIDSPTKQPRLKNTIPNSHHQAHGSDDYDKIEARLKAIESVLGLDGDSGNNMHKVQIALQETCSKLALM